MNLNDIIDKLNQSGDKGYADLLQDIGAIWSEQELIETKTPPKSAFVTSFKTEDDYIINLANNSQAGAYNVH